MIRPPLLPANSKKMIVDKTCAAKGTIQEVPLCLIGIEAKLKAHPIDVHFLTSFVRFSDVPSMLMA